MAEEYKYLGILYRLGGQVELPVGVPAEHQLKKMDGDALRRLAGLTWIGLSEMLGVFSESITWYKDETGGFTPLIPIEKVLNGTLTRRQAKIVLKLAGQVMWTVLFDSKEGAEEKPLEHEVIIGLAVLSLPDYVIGGHIAKPNAAQLVEETNPRALEVFRNSDFVEPSKASADSIPTLSRARLQRELISFNR